MNEPKGNPPLPDKLPLSKAFLWIALSTLIISGTTALCLVYYHYYNDRLKLDQAYDIVAIVQTSAEAEGLQTAYLAQLLDISCNRPTNLYAFNSKEACKKLLNCPLIKEATVRKIRPGTIHIDYTLRKPIAFLGDYTNTVIDSEGMALPFKPFFTPKKLPEIYLGEDDAANGSKTLTPPAELWGTKLSEKKLELAFSLLDLIKSQCCDDFTTLCCIDISKANALSYGQRQIVIALEDRIQRVVDGRQVLCISPRFLRLEPENYHQQLANYLVLRNYLRQQEKSAPLTAFTTIAGATIQAKATIIDLRLPDLAFLAKEP